jgi:uncharacterized membrane protein YgcG
VKAAAPVQREDTVVEVLGVRVEPEVVQAALDLAAAAVQGGSGGEGGSGGSGPGGGGGSGGHR